MQLRYAEHLATRPDQPCPCSEHKPNNVVAWRLMHDPATDDVDFIAPAFMGGGTLKPRDKCSRLGLSFFLTVEGVRNLFAVLNEREDAALRYGDSVGKIALVEADGLIGPVNKRGHFNLHPAVEAVFSTRVTEYQSARADSAKR